MPGTKGNLNALKHGLYAQRFTKPERVSLSKMPMDDLRQEIVMLRVVTDRILKRLAEPEEGKPLIETKELSGLVYSLTLAVTTLNTTARTHALLNGTYSPLNDALMEALARIPVFDDILEEPK